MASAEDIVTAVEDDEFRRRLVLTTTFTEPPERGKAFGVYGAIAGGGGLVGLPLGGLLTQCLDWRWCLYVNLVFAGRWRPSARRCCAISPGLDRCGSTCQGC